MTIAEAIERADMIRPNKWPAALKVRWLSELDGRLALDVFHMAPEDAAPFSGYEGTETLLVDPPYDDIYPLWLQAKIDEANGEYEKYQNSRALYDGAYTDFLAWFLNTYDPANGYERRREDGI